MISTILKIIQAIFRRKWVRVTLITVASTVIFVAILMALAVADAWSGFGKRPHGERLERIQASPNYRNGHFVNQLPGRKPDTGEIARKKLSKSEYTIPESSLDTLKLVANDYRSKPASGLRISWLGHSTTLVEIDGERILIDPIWSERCSPVSWAGPRRFFAPPLALDALPSLDAILISHDHYDHLDEATIRKLKKLERPFIVPLGVGSHLEYWGVAPELITEVDWWDEVEVGALTITATPARHFSGRLPTDESRNSTLWTGYALVGPAHRIYYSGDTAMFDGFKEIGERLGPFDAAMIEIGAYNQMWPDSHLGPEQAVEAFEHVQGGMMIPMHWGTFNLAFHGWTEPIERFVIAAQAAGIDFVAPRPGERIEPSSPPQLVRWWPQVPWQDAEEYPIVSTMLAYNRDAPVTE